MRVEVLQVRLDMLALTAARAFVYSDYPGGSATGTKFDAVLDSGTAPHWSGRQSRTGRGPRGEQSTEIGANEISPRLNVAGSMRGGEGVAKRDAAA